MKKSMYSALTVGGFFGCICYFICSFFLGIRFSGVLGLSTGIIYFLIFSVWGIINAKKQARILSEYVNDFLFKETVNYYGDNGLFNGLLVLTESTLFFVATEKKRFKIDYPLQQIAGIEYGKASRHIPGLRVLMQDGTSGRFSMTQKEYELLEETLKHLSPTLIKP